MTGQTSQCELRCFTAISVPKSVQTLSTRRVLQVLKPYKVWQIYTVCHNISALAREMGPLEFNTHCATRWTSSLKSSFMGNQRIFFPAQHQMVAVGNKFSTVSPLLAWCPAGSQAEKWPSIHFSLSKEKASGFVSQNKILMHQAEFEMMGHYFWRQVEILLAHRLSTSW